MKLFGIMKRLSIVTMMVLIWLPTSMRAQEYHYDVNNDGEVNITDAMLVVDYVLNKPMAVDLGLPSGTKWASCNVGATKPEEYGGYYAWGETKEKDSFTEESYAYCNGSFYSSISFLDIGSDISGTQYDVAHVKWGGKWRMPTKEECMELMDYCKDEWTTYNGVNGRKFTSKINDNSIFLPAAGDRWDGGRLKDGEEGYYWSSTVDPTEIGRAYNLVFYSRNAQMDHYYYRCIGESVRPVMGTSKDAVRHQIR